ncbi:MAG: hypothetical protein HS115_01215 [Spirochaetales bacterium]|nr:hypothetical protein [Spirochaetales bacterium]
MNSERYSPQAIDRRLRRVSELLRLCKELRQAGARQSAEGTAARSDLPEMRVGCPEGGNQETQPAGQHLHRASGSVR